MKYDVILADPPWTFETWNEQGKGRSAERHYATLDNQDIAALRIDKLKAKDSVLLLWATSPLLLQAINAMRLWGFKYKTVAFTWVKTTKLDETRAHFGMGYYTRANTEYVLLGTSGAALRVEDHAVPQLVVAPVGKHSEKPVAVHERIERLFGPDTRKLELFARRHRDGWTCTGLELDGCDIRAFIDAQANPSEPTEAHAEVHGR